MTEEALQIAEKGREPKGKREKKSEKQRRKGKIYPFECRIPKNSEER